MPQPETASLGVRPEYQLLLCCARTAMDVETKARARQLLAGELDWGYILRQANRHGVVPLVYKNLRKLSGEQTPSEVLDELRTAFDRNRHRNMFMTAELIRILGLLESADIRVIPLKGPLLAASVFGDLALRQFVDLDILVDEKNMMRAREILAIEGYEPAQDWTPSQTRFIFRTHCELPLFSKERQLLVEIHWRIVRKWFRFPLGAEHLWDRLRPAELAGYSTFTVGPEDLLLILCVHSNKHMWSRLRWLCDVAEVLRAHPEIDWTELMTRAEAFGARRMLFLGLYLANDLLDAPLPDEIRIAVRREPQVHSLASQVRAWLDREFLGPVGYGIPGHYDRSLFYVRSMERLRDRLHYLVGYITTPSDEDWDVVRLPDRLFALYYIIRLLRLGQWIPRWTWKKLCSIGRALVSAGARPVRALLGAVR